MKAKFTAKKALSIMLAVLMLFTVMSIPASAEENKCPHIDSLGDEGWETIKAPTCSSSGEKRKWCADCVDWAYASIPNTPGENHVPGAWIETTQHTCSSTGVREIRCTQAHCGAVIKTEVVPAHDYSIVYGSEPTCMKDGYRFVKCTTCYDSMMLTLPKDDTAHTYGEWQVTKEATCTVEGERTRFCLNRADDATACKATETESYTDKDNHVNITWFEDETVEPTCKRDGYTPGKCDDCGEEVRKIIPMHSTSYYTVISTVPSTCHTHGSEYRRCICGLEYEVELPLDKDNHVYTDWRISKEPGCEPGERYKVCVYEYDVRLTQEIPATGEHKYGEWVVTQEPLCSATGVKEKTCSICGDKVTEVIPVKHDLAKWTTVTKMCCDETSLQQGTKYAECDNCNYKTYFTVPAVHSFGPWRVTSPADCKLGKNGTMERTCSGCGKTEVKQFAAEHEFSDWFVTDKPVCATEGTTGRTGMYTRVCLHCRYKEQKQIPVTHEYVDVEILTYPVCLENGQCISGTKIVECKHCGKVVKDAAITGAHSYGEWETVKDATCSAETKDLVEGSRRRSCKVCGYVQYETTDGKHSFTDWVMPEGTRCGDKAAENEEFRLTRTCTKCGKTEEKDVAAIDHPNAVTIETEATCSTSGYTKERCPDCGYEKLIGEIVPALGHDLDADWTIRTEATCNSGGSRYKACSRCEYLEFEEIARTLHTLIELVPGTPATCVLPGTSPKSYCGVCFEEFDHQPIPALGHTYNEGSEICSRCNAYKESNNCGCACHSTSGMESIFFKIIVKLYQFFGINQQCSCGELHYDEPGFLAKLFGKA